MISNSYYRDHTNIFLGDKHENTIAELRLVNHILNENFTLNDLYPYFPKLSIEYDQNKYPKFSQKSKYVILLKHNHEHYMGLSGVYSNIYYIPYDLDLVIIKNACSDPDDIYNRFISLECDNIETILKQSREIPKEGCLNDYYHTYGAEVIHIEGKLYKRFTMPDLYLFDMKKMNYPKIFTEIVCYLFPKRSRFNVDIHNVPKYKMFNPNVFSCDNELYNYIGSPHYRNY